MTPDGRCFRWAFSGEAIGAGQLVMQKGAVANHDMDLATAAAAAVGATTITVTIANSASGFTGRSGYVRVYGGFVSPLYKVATTNFAPITSLVES